MAQYVVPPKNKSVAIIKCWKCGTMYVPETMYKGLIISNYEPCPVCGCRTNDEDNLIPLWKYNLIKWIRGGFKDEGHREDGSKFHL